MTTPGRTPRPRLDEIAAGPVDDVDLGTLSRLAALYDRLDPVPAGLIERVHFGLTLDALHAEIAELQRVGDLAGVRSAEATEARTITFTSASLTVMITLTPVSADLVRVDGWAAPAGDIVIELRTLAGTNRCDVDEDGRFVFDEVPRGLAQLLVTPTTPGRAAVITPSLEI